MGRPVRNVYADDRGNLWPDAAAAARETGGARASILAAANRPDGHCAGRQWFGVPLAWHERLWNLLDAALPPRAASRPSGRKSLW